MRLFTGLAIPPDATAALQALTRGLPDLPELKWTRPEKLHITTAFIGDWPDARLADVKTALEQVRADALSVRVRGLGCMPSPRFPRSLYAGVEPTPHLLSLAAETARVLASVGVPLEDRVYHPHITLARVKGRLKSAIPLHADPIAAFPASSFYLYLSADGKYTKLQEFSFVKS